MLPGPFRQTVLIRYEAEGAMMVLLISQYNASMLYIEG